MTLISIDASTTKTGICIFEVTEDALLYKTHHLLVAPKADYHKAGKNQSVYKKFKLEQTKSRVEYMITHLYTYFMHYQPDVIIMEDIYTKSDPHSVKMLGRIQGAVLGYGLDKGCHVIFTSPQEWRSRVGIKSREGNTIYKRPELKKQAVALVKDIYGLLVTDDEAEAICIGLSYKNDCDKSVF